MRAPEELNEVDWAALEHAYGPAGDVPEMICVLYAEESPETERGESVGEELINNLNHQGSLYPATVGSGTVPGPSGAARDLASRSCPGRSVNSPDTSGRHRSCRRRCSRTTPPPSTRPCAACCVRRPRPASSLPSGGWACSLRHSRRRSSRCSTTTEYGHSQAADAYWRITGNPRPVLPLLLTRAAPTTTYASNDTAWYDRRDALRVLAGMRTACALATTPPELRPLLELCATSPRRVTWKDDDELRRLALTLLDEPMPS